MRDGEGRRPLRYRPRIGLPMAKTKHRGSNAKRRARDGLVPRRTVIIAGHPTSVTLEDAFWDGVKEIAAAKGISASKLVTTINRKRRTYLSSAIRLFVLDHYRCRR